MSPLLVLAFLLLFTLWVARRRRKHRDGTLGVYQVVEVDLWRWQRWDVPSKRWWL